MFGDAKKLAAIRETLIEQVSRGNLESAYSLVASTIGGVDTRGWGYSTAPTIDLMRRIIELRPGTEGIDLAVSALCGMQIFGPARNPWSQARYEQDIEQYRALGFVGGVELHAQEWSCAQGKKRAGCYRLRDVPIFPDPACDCESGCVCWWSPINDGNDPATPWRRLESSLPAPAMPADLRRRIDDGS